MIQPTPILTKDRNFTIDVMRGIAVLGILLMNIPGYATHQFFLFWGDILAGETTTNGFIFKSAILLFDGRMRGLFTILFGAGIMLFIENKKEQSIHVADAYFKRMTWLMIFGLVDSFVLLWRGDVLFEYALCGIFIFVFRNARVRYLLLTSACLFTIFSLQGGKNFYKYKALSEVYKQVEVQLAKGLKVPEEQMQQHDDFKQVLERHYPFSEEIITSTAKEITDDYLVHRSGYIDIFMNHAESTIDYLNNVFLSIFSESFAAILLGMAMYKLGFFHGRLKKSTYWLIAVVGTVLGLALVALNMKLQVRTQAELWEAYTWRFFSIVYIEHAGRILSMIGYAGIIYLLCTSVKLAPYLRVFANTGRMALTNYLMQTVLCSLYFFGFGLGFYGQYQPKGLLVFVIVIWVVQIVYSNVYLSYYRMGPVEWLWKRLTYGKAAQSNETGN